MPELRSVEIKISKTIHIKQLYHLLESGDLSNIKCIIDLRDFGFFYPLDIVLLTQLLISLAHDGCTSIAIIADFEGKHKYLYDIGLIEFCNKNVQQPQTIEVIVSQTAMPIKRVERQNMVQYISMAQQFLNSIRPDKDMAFLNIGLSELINNVYDHSKSPVGAYVFCQYYPKKGIIRFAVSDIGIGIPKSVNDYLSSINQATMEDRECIDWAFEEKNTVKSTPRNAGLGLNTVMSFVKANKGSIRLLSDTIGMYSVDGSNKYFVNPVKPFKGTVVDIEIKVDNLQEIDEEEVDFEI